MKPSATPATPIRFSFILFGLTAFLVLNGCAWLMAPPQSDPEATQHLTRWAEHNAGLKRFKGLLRVQIKAQGQTLNGRAALAGIIPDRLRVELLQTLGQPITSLVGDGTTIRVHAVSEGRFYQWDQTGSALERFIHVPVGIDALLEVLSGRPPLPAYVAAQMDAKTEDARDIVLKDRWNSVVAAVQCDAEGRIRTFRSVDVEGVAQYEVHWDAWQQVAGYDLPRTVRMISGRGDQVTWTLERFWPDVEIPPGTFVLEGAGDS
jgi:outer membrane biogenesis lipoprotein LolB